ncbi:MAG: type I restriction enzyme HsdR N-terminal domain-containing protein [Chitinophagales bacterium]|nr:type I restriction enzyme HsdR N-terminal domain-containing protein [Chitinophagales bacterium]
MIVNFGQYKIRMKQENQIKYIYDIVRKKWIIAKPEEEVRQLWLHYLTEDKNYSLSKIAVEKSFYINDKLKRFDICVYDVHAKPYLLIECKAPNHKLDRSVMEQISRYNLSIGAKVFIISNGIFHQGVCIQDNKLLELAVF